MIFGIQEVSSLVVGVLRLGLGNIGSLSHAFSSLGDDPVMVEKVADFQSLTHLVIPGVGSFSAGIAAMHHADIYCAVKEFASAGNPVLGICLGMQLLTNAGSEYGVSEGLSLIPGQAVKMERIREIKLPHMGWNEVNLLQPNHPVLKGIRSGVDFYFAHSNRVVCSDPQAIIALTDHGQSFPSIIGNKNIIGVQFHPEKSQKNGLRLLENFSNWDGS